VRWLVERGAEVDATGCYNGESYVQLTPHCAAVYYHKAKVAEYLRAQGAQLDIFRAAFMGEQAQVARELDAHPELLNAEDPHDNIYYVPLLDFAVAGGHAALLDFLLRRGAQVAQYSAQLLYLAARDGRLDLLDLLVAHGAQAQAMDSGTFVHVDVPMMEILLRLGVSATQPGKNRQPPLVYLARGDKGEHPEKLAVLLDYGADANAAGDNGKTALHYAAAAEHLRVMALLLERGAAPNVRDNQGETPLSLARAAGKTEAAALLRQRGARA
jgi:ankyrin repeat protein